MDFYTTRIQGFKTLEDTIRRTEAFLFYLTREKNVFCNTEFVHPRDGNMCESKEINKFCNKLFMQVDLIVEFHKEKHNLYKSHKNIT